MPVRASKPDKDRYADPAGADSKARTSLYGQIEAFITRHHSYEVPEIVQIPIQGGLPGYLNWIDEVTGT